MNARETLRRHGALVPVLGALAAIAVVATWLLGHGIAATWRVQGRTLARTTEYRTSFPNVHRPLSRVIQAWDFARLGIPPVLPPLDATIEAELDVPARGGARELRVVSPNGTRLSVGGAPAAGLLPPGRHAIAVAWSGSFDGDVALRLEWSDRDGAQGTMVPIPRSALRPPGGAPVAPRLLVWLAALALGAGFAFYMRDPGRRPQRWSTVAMAAILLGGSFLRLYDYQVMPDFRENDDELFATWNGWQLLHTGTTRGWTMWPDAAGGRVKLERLDYFRKSGFTVITPYFEHPPLLHLLVGGAATLGGAHHWSHARLVHTRLVPAALSIACLLLVMLLARELCAGSAPAILAGIVYATLPTVVLQARAIKEESLLTALVLGSLLGLAYWRRTRSRRALIAAAVAAALEPITKMTGSACLAAFLLLVLLERDRDAFKIALAAAAGGIALLLLYAGVESWSLFWNTSYLQGTRRPTQFNLFSHWFDFTQVNSNSMGRGWILGLWALAFLGLGLAGEREREATARTLYIPLVFYIVGVTIPSGNWTFGWYMLPVYPLLCVAAGGHLAALYREQRLALLGGLVLVGLWAMYSLNFVFPLDYMKARAHWPHTRSIVTAVVGFGMLPFVIAELRWRLISRIAGRTGMIAALGTMVALDAWIIVDYDYVYDAFKGFDSLTAFFW
jgi:4-amino-4-deoxy-L-arabinose transferase-like glycosyltransferase